MSFYINFSLIRTGIPLICAAKVRNSDVRTEQIGSCCITKNTETIKWGQQIKKGKKKYHNFQSSRTFSWFQNYSMIPKGWLFHEDDASSPNYCIPSGTFKKRVKIISRVYVLHPLFKKLEITLQKLDFYREKICEKLELVHTVTLSSAMTY